MSATARPALAQWVPDGVAVTGLTADQSAPVSVSDGAGGVILAWRAGSGASADLYAQRLNEGGQRLWGPDGIRVCGASDSQEGPVVVASGDGGAIIAWTDRRSPSNANVYAQRLDAFGDDLWTTDGVALCLAAGDQVVSAIVSDQSNGAIVAWKDSRAGTPGVYVRRITAAGSPTWTGNGVALCTAGGNEQGIVLVADLSGGAIAAWQDNRGASADIYARRILANGTVQWTANGDSICAVAGDQTSPTIAARSPGGAYIAWSDARGANADIYIQAINSSGATMSTLWTATGVAVCGAGGDQILPQLASDPALNVLVATWQDGRSDAGDVYARRVSVAGVPQWSADGVALCTASQGQVRPSAAMAGDGEVAVAWVDTRSGSDSDVYAQVVDSTGVIVHAADGVRLCGATGDQDNLSIVHVADPRTLVVGWTDTRAGGQDAYAQRLGSAGDPGFDFSISTNAGAGGRIIPEGTIPVNQGATQGFAFAPNAFSRVQQVYIDAAPIGAVLHHGLTGIVADHTVAATFLTDTAGAYAGWVADGTVLAGATSARDQPAIASDGRGGAILTWRDARNAASGYDIYAQRLTAGGAPMWAPGGVVVCSAAGDQDNPRLVVDTSGAAIIIWKDARIMDEDIYAQRLDPDGAPMWSANGVAVGTSTGFGFPYHTIAPDGSGGAIVAWCDIIRGDLYAQHLNSAGVPTWTANGEKVSANGGTDTHPAAISDGAGGAFVAWHNQGGPDSAFVARVDGAGAVLWQLHVSSSGQSGIEPSVRIAADIRGGALVGWNDAALGIFHIQRLSHEGEALWGLDGVIVNSGGSSGSESLAGDGQGGAVAAWASSSGGFGVAVQRLDASGAKLWGTSGVNVCSGCGPTLPRTSILSDGSGGATVAWSDARVSPTDGNLYAQRLNAAGSPQWAANGVAICTASGQQTGPMIVPAASAIAAWTDMRSDTSVVAQRINGAGVAGFDHTITASAGTHGSIAPMGATGVFAGTSQSFAITADAGYHVLDVLVDGLSVGAPTSYTFTGIATNHTIAATFSNVPVISQVVPDRGGNIASTTVVVRGNGFHGAATARLVRTGQADIIGTAVTVSANGDSLATTFDLDARALGSWDVVVTNPSAISGSLPAGFTIDAGAAPRLRVDVVGPDLIRASDSTLFRVSIENLGNVDAVAVPLWITGIPTDASVGLDFALAAPPQDPGDPDWSLVPDTLTSGGGRYLTLVIPRIPPGVIVRRIYLTVPPPDPPGLRTVQLGASLTPPWMADTTSLRDCLADAGVIQNVACPGGRLAALQAHLAANPQIEALNGVALWAKIAWKCEGATTLPQAIARASEILGFLAMTAEGGAAPIGCGDVLLPRWRTVLTISVGSSFDPNDKLSPSGAVHRAQPILYTIRFENKPPIATLPAHTVTITDVLPITLDPTSVTTGAIILYDDNGNSVRREFLHLPLSGYTTDDIDLGSSRPKVRVRVERFGSELTWTFNSVHRTTGQIINTGGQGFLPVNTDPSTHRGEGSVEFTAVPSSSATDGTVISNLATINFDNLSSIETEATSNVLDDLAPTSSINSLPSPLASPTFTVSWQGFGAGIQDYTIYYSTDGGPYYPWREFTPDLSAEFIPVPGGHTYRFYSRARDVHSNEEPPKSDAQAVMVVSTVDVGPSGPWKLSLEGVWPNPAIGEMAVRFTLPSRQPATVELIDVTGRRVARHEVGSLGPGRHVLTLGKTPRLRSGLYFLRLIQAGVVLRSRVAFIR